MWSKGDNEVELYCGNKWKIYNGNMLDMREVIEDGSIDSIVTDPPYELNFMGKGWDNSGIAFQSDTWRRCFDALKSGGYLLAFGGSRTFHRIAVAIEDAGFEIRDTIMWLYGSGFPKSMNIGLAIDKKNGIESKVVGTQTVPDIRGDAFGTMNEKQGGSYKNITRDIKQAQNEWQGWGTALKPSYEPIIIARKPCEGSCTDNVLKYGVGGINIDECRVEPTGEDLGRKNNVKSYGGITINESNTPAIDRSGRYEGRFPANTILTYDETDFDEVCGGMPDTKSQKPRNVSDKYTSQIYGKYAERQENCIYSDSGSAARYFYCAKTSKRDRDEGLDEFELKTGGGMSGTADQTLLTGSGNIRNNLRKNTHPTVKPTSLMQYLVRLVTPKGGTVLDPFNGSGSTGKAVMYENKERNADYKYIGIELTKEYIPISVARIEFASKECDESEEKETKEKQMTIFDFIGSENE